MLEQIPQEMVRQALMKHIPNPQPNECWRWYGPVTRIKPGDCKRFSPLVEIQGRERNARKISYESWHGYKIPTGHLAIPTCNQPLCVNPFHLCDMNVAEITIFSKINGHLTHYQVNELCMFKHEHGWSTKNLAARYDVTPAGVNYHVRRSHTSKVEKGTMTTFEPQSPQVIRLNRIASGY